MIPISAQMGKLLAGLRQSSALEKIASEASGEDLGAVLLAKRQADSALFEIAKQASAVTTAATAVADAAAPAAKAGLMDTVRGGLSKAWNHPVGGKVLGGAAVATGAAVPAVIAGNMISDHATESARDRALQAGAGLAALGGTMYGIHRLTSNAKTAAEEIEWLDEAVDKLASIGYLDEMLAGPAANDPKVAELRDLNREYGVEILRNLVG